MLGFACRAPFDNAVSITTGGRSTLGLDDSAILAQFGIKINKQLLTVMGRELVPPRIVYNVRNKLAPHPTVNGSWNMRDTKVVKAPSTIRNWCWLAFSERPPTAEQRSKINDGVAAFTASLNRNGIPIAPTTNGSGGFFPCRNDRMESDVLEAFGSINSGIGGANKHLFLLIILPRADTRLYAYIKQCADVKHGYHSICVVERNFTRGDPMTFANIGLKWNLKNGGINHKLHDPVGLIKDGETMVVGYDVTHPTNLGDKKKGNKDEGGKSVENRSPSLVGLVASIDKDLGQWPSVAWEQDSRMEMLDDKFVGHFGTRLDLWKRHNGKWPEYIMIYRDGVSEGQFSQVLTKELPHIRAACAKRYQQGKMPKISIVVSVKRHQTRFFPTSTDNMTRKGNIKPGTVVDRGITQARVWDFYLTAHEAIQGTARPAHYTVLLDEIFRSTAKSDAANQLEKMTLQLCYTFGRATKAVSICPPAYYADIVCERARVHRPGYADGSDAAGTPSSSLILGNTTAEVHERLKDTMYYI